MFEGKESFWKKKGFYLSACTAILCVLAIGTVYYKISYQNNNGQNLFADSATTAPDNATSNTAGGPAISEGTNDVNDNSSSEDAVSVAQNNPQEKENVSPQPASTPASSENAQNTDNSQTDNTTEKYTADTSKANKAKKETVLADASKTDKAQGSTEKKSSKKGAEKKDNNNTGKNIKNTDNSVATMTEPDAKNKFDMEKGLLWPVDGDIILKYSMNNTVYFKTLAQYKCNPAIIISSEEGTNVKAAADGTVSKITKSDETGNLVTVDIGSGYSVTYGQLDDISVKEGQFIKEGSSIGKIAKPTKYYSEEGSNLYLQVMENDKPVDPMLLLR